MGPKKKRLWAPAIKIVNALKAVQSYLPASTEKNANMFFALFNLHSSTFAENKDG